MLSFNVSVQHSADTSEGCMAFGYAPTRYACQVGIFTTCWNRLLRLRRGCGISMIQWRQQGAFHTGFLRHLDIPAGRWVAESDCNEYQGRQEKWGS